MLQGKHGLGIGSDVDIYIKDKIVILFYYLYYIFVAWHQFIILTFTTKRVVSFFFLEIYLSSSSVWLNYMNIKFFVIFHLLCYSVNFSWMFTENIALFIFTCIWWGINVCKETIYNSALYHKWNVKSFCYFY